MGISVALTPATTVVTVSKSMITNASFRTKKLPGEFIDMYFHLINPYVLRASIIFIDTWFSHISRNLPSKYLMHRLYITYFCVVRSASIMQSCHAIFNLCAIKPLLLSTQLALKNNHANSILFSENQYTIKRKWNIIKIVQKKNHGGLCGRLKLNESLFENCGVILSIKWQLKSQISTWTKLCFRQNAERYFVKMKTYIVPNCWTFFSRCVASYTKHKRVLLHSAFWVRKSQTKHLWNWKASNYFYYLCDSQRI